MGTSVKIGVLRFPGTNCDRDVFEAIETSGVQAVWLWHEDQFQYKDLTAVVLPGGFSYGDYLRSGAIAARAVAMRSVREAAEYGTPILGICNGFQTLCEAGLLPGVLMRNKGGRFIDTLVSLIKEGSHSPFGANLAQGAVLRVPIAHADGRYFAPEEVLKSLQDHDQIWLRYLENPNGSIHDIAGVTNVKGNVAGLMPHPERAYHSWMEGLDGRKLLEIWK